MGLDSRPAQIVALTVTVAAIMGFMWLTEVWGQTRLKDVPIVSDRAIAKADTIRIVDKDEQQRVVEKLVLRIQKLENRVINLELQLENLKEEVEGG